MTSYVDAFKHYPGWWTAWCLECQRNVFVDRDRFTVQEMAFYHDDVHHRVDDAFAGPEFTSGGPDDLYDQADMKDY